MPTGVTMYVRLDRLPSADRLQSLRNEFMQTLALTPDDFYISGPLILVPAGDRGDMPVKDESSVWLDVNLWKSYFGPGYERGNAELFVKTAEWLEQHLPGAEVYYGHDVGDENVRRFDVRARKKLLELYKTSRS